MRHDTIRAAVVQAGSVLLDRRASLAKALQLIADTASRGARLVVFPEAFLAGYPRGLSFGALVGSRSEAGRDLFAAYHGSAIDVPGPETEALAAAAKKAGVHVVIGVVERDRVRRRGTLYCTILFFDDSGRLLGKHRKLKPTAAERLIWGEGDGRDLRVYDTAIGRLGGLICWENYMPLARALLYQQGIELYAAPTADNRDSWQATIRHIACEGRCFVLACNQFITRADYPDALRNLPELAQAPEPLCRGGSAIIDPFGDYLAGPLFGAEGILVADLPLGQIVRARFDFDAAGHYARPELLHLLLQSHGNP